MSKLDMLIQCTTHIGGGVFACPGGVAKDEFNLSATPSRNVRFLRTAAEDRSRRIPLKNSQIEQLRKSRSGAHSVV
jgi:hypothetical protein